MEYTKYTYQELINDAISKKLILPNFQRDYVWKPDAQELLLASFLVNLPIGSFLILEGDGNDFFAKELCFNNIIERTDKQCYYLLDGQQRLSTIKNIFYDHLSIKDWKKNIDPLHFQLQNKWFLSIEGGEEDILGYQKLRFKIPVYDDKTQRTVTKAKLATLEPTDVIDNIKQYKIYKNGSENFYHPDTDLGEGSIYDKQMKLSIKCADKGVLPLFDILTEDKTIIRNTLKYIADSKSQALAIKVGNDISLAEDHLGHLDSEIIKKYQEGRLKEVNIRWESLKEKWVSDILEYFKDLFKSEIMIPTVKSNELARATSVFEFMNKGGTALDTFDIIVAKYADIGQKETLYTILDKGLKKTEYISSSLSEMSDTVSYSPENFGIYSKGSIVKPIKEQFLNLLSIFNAIATKELKGLGLADIKKNEILKLKQVDINRHINNVIKALYRSLAFLQFRCGIDNFNKLSYKLMILPISVILHNDNNWNDNNVLNKLEFWYWASLFSGRYRERQNQRTIDDIKELNKWINFNQDTDILNRMQNIFKETNYSDLDTLLLQNEDGNVPKAIHNGLLQYVLSLQPNDFSKEEKKLRAWEISESKETLQDHHIIPLGSVNELGQSAKNLRDKNKKGHILNSPLNRTFISNTANNCIKAMSIERYIPFLNGSIKHSHCITKLPEKSYHENEEMYKEYLIDRFSTLESQILNELERLKR